jgi:signal transduction histidine kinase
MTLESLRPPLVGLGLALGVAAVGLASVVGPLNVTELGMFVLIGWSFIVAGVVAWVRRPENPLGPLMTVTGVVWLGRDAIWWHSPVGAQLHPFFLGVFLALIAHQLIVYPHGRVRSRAQLLLLCAAYVLAIGGYVVGELFNDPRLRGCSTCSRNLLLVYGDNTLNSIANDGPNLLAGIVAAAILAMLVLRWRAAGPPGRRTLAPIIWTAPAAVAIAVLGFVRDSGVPVGSALNQIENNGAIIDAAIPIAFLVGLLRMRLQRAGMTDLVVELSKQPPPSRLRAALAAALGDPSLEVALWLPGQHRYVDLDGTPIDVQPGDGRSVSVLEDEHQPLAALIYDESLLEDRSLVEASAAAARLALQNARLQAELRAQLAAVRASRTRILAAADEERRRLERDLHDGAQQRLLATRLALQLVRGRARSDRETETLLDEADAEVQGALDDIRALARGLHPAILSDEGLEAALAALARRSPIPVEIGSVPAERLPVAVETAAYFLASEALANTAKHASATRVRIDVRRENGTAVVLVDDDGIGGASTKPGGGLSGLCDRIAALGGMLSVASPPGGGTELRAEIPCA